MSRRILLPTIFHDVAELFVVNAPVSLSVILHHLLSISAAQLCLLANSQGQATQKLVLGDNTRAKLVVVTEEIQCPDTVLVDGNTDLVKDSL